MPNKDSSPGTHLEHLFDMELEYRQGMARVLLDRGKIGDYLGSGEGSVFGLNVNGVVHWDLFREEDEFLCGSNLRGLIETDDGSRINFDSVGYFMRPDMSRPTEWFAAASVNFKSDSQLYNWLNTILAVSQGVYDMGSSHHSYRIYSQVAD
jgi:hypothetical protein